MTYVHHFREELGGLEVPEGLVFDGELGEVHEAAHSVHDAVLVIRRHHGYAQNRPHDRVLVVVFTFCVKRACRRNSSIHVICTTPETLNGSSRKVGSSFWSIRQL